ncbi:MAG: phosphoenolpyruvate--protein phosphotransferase [Acidobacteriota bacterium]
MAKVQEFPGRGLAPGWGEGVVCLVGPPMPQYVRLKIRPEEVERELERFRNALEAARRQYVADRDKLLELLGKDHAAVIEAHLAMLGDPHLTEEVSRRVREQHESAESALRRVAEKWAEAYGALEDEFFQERGFDFQEVIDRVIGQLVSLQAPSEPEAEHSSLVLVGRMIPLAELSRFRIERVKGLVAAQAGRTSHLSIIARSLGIPLVSAVPEAVLAAGGGGYAAVSGSEGKVWLAESFDQLEDVRRKYRGVELPLAPEQAGPLTTRDGVRVELLVNLELPEEAEKALKLGAEGVGLFRSEFLYLTQSVPGKEGEFFENLYRQLVAAFPRGEIVVRTLDVSRPPEGTTAGEEFGALGLRGIRVGLREVELLRKQVRPVVRLRFDQDVRIVLPMVSDVDELRQAKAIIRQVEREEGLPSSRVTPVGVLLEVPAALFTLEELLDECDFLEVGTNDLTQYILAVGRRSEQLADAYNPLHPAMLRVLRAIARGAAKKRRPVTVCGEMAGEPIAALLLVGLGYRRLSMGPYSLPRVRDILGAFDLPELESWVARLEAMSSPSEVRRFLSEHVEREVERRIQGAYAH